MNIKDLKNRIYNDFISSFNNAITPLKKSLFEQLSNTLSATFNLIYIYLDRIYNDSFLTTCTSSRVLDYFAPLKNITRKEPTIATGVVRFYGINTTVINSDIGILYNGLEYKTSEAGAISSGFVDLNCESIGKGTENNTLPNVDLLLSTPINGVDNKATSIDGFSSAIDEETIESVRTRTKQKNATLTQVDNDNFYKSLANELSNVKATFISDIKNGEGTFGVTILTFSNDGVPIQSDIDQVESYFTTNNAVPVYVDAEYFLPTITLQAFSIQLAVTNEDNKTNIEQAIRDYLYLKQKPGTTFQFSGLSDYLQDRGARLTNPDPSSDYAIAADEILDLGVVSWI